MAEKREVKLAQERVAAIVPRVCKCWSRLCWTVFALGMLTVLLAIAVLGKVVPDFPELRYALVAVLFMALVLASINTFWAATQFTARRDALKAWLTIALELTSADRSVRTFRVPEDTTESLGHLEMEVRAEPAETWLVSASGAYRPEPSTTEATGFPGTWSHAAYLALLRGETNAARLAAARIAGALAYLFVVAIQVFGNLKP